MPPAFVRLWPGAGIRVPGFQAAAFGDEFHVVFLALTGAWQVGLALGHAMNGFGNLRHPGGAYAVSRYVKKIEPVIFLRANSEHGLVKKFVAGIRAIPVVGIVTAVMDVAG